MWARLRIALVILLIVVVSPIGYFLSQHGTRHAQLSGMLGVVVPANATIEEFSFKSDAVPEWLGLNQFAGFHIAGKYQSFAKVVMNSDDLSELNNRMRLRPYFGKDNADDPQGTKMVAERLRNDAGVAWWAPDQSKQITQYRLNEVNQNLRKGTATEIRYYVDTHDTNAIVLFVHTIRVD